LGLELRAPIFRQAVVLPAAAALRRSPLRCDEAVTLQPVQHRIQHAVGPMQMPPGQLVDALDDGVAVALTLGEDGEHEWRRRGGDEVFSEVHTSEPYTLNFYVWSRSTCAAGDRASAWHGERQLSCNTRVRDVRCAPPPAGSSATPIRNSPIVTN